MQNAFVGFLLEIANIFMGKKDGLLMPALSRKEELFEQFLQLLFEHCKEQHVVTFYAEKLFITPQYLSLILKELTGKSANKWIDDALIVEAKILLKAPQATVQQVADMLHFPISLHLENSLRSIWVFPRWNTANPDSFHLWRNLYQLINSIIP